MKILDRYIIRNSLINCLLALAVMIGMYILLDVIVNFNLFTRNHAYQHATALQAFWGLKVDRHEIGGPDPCFFHGHRL